MKHLFFFFTKNKNRAVFIAAVWTLLILVACFIPGRDVPDVHVPLIDKWVHLVLFGGFTFLWLCIRRQPVPLTGLLVFLASVALGYLVELVQGSGITSGRSYDLYDVLADSIGGLLGVLLYFGVRRFAIKNI